MTEFSMRFLYDRTDNKGHFPSIHAGDKKCKRGHIRSTHCSFMTTRFDVIAFGHALVGKGENPDKTTGRMIALRRCVNYLFEEYNVPGCERREIWEKFVTYHGMRQFKKMLIPIVRRDNNGEIMIEEESDVDDKTDAALKALRKIEVPLS